MEYMVNQIVRGVNCGTFVILGTRTVGGRMGYQIKEVNPNNLSECARGELWFTHDMLKAYN